MKVITSKQNNFIKDLKKQKVSNKFLLFLDNPKVIKEAVNKNINIYTLLIDQTRLKSFEYFLDKAPNVVIVNDEIIKIFTDVKTPQGIIAVCQLPQNEMKVPENNYLVLDGLQDAGNVGTLIRTACGFGITDIYLLDSVAVSNSKVVRSTMGTLFNVNIYQISRTEFVRFASENNLLLVCADMGGESAPTAKFNNKIGLVLGNEGNGVSNELKGICQSVVSIPMENSLESFNVAVAGGILMYEIKRRNYERT